MKQSSIVLQNEVRGGQQTVQHKPRIDNIYWYCHTYSVDLVGQITRSYFA